MKEWIPLVQQKDNKNALMEHFVEEKQSQSIVGAVFTGIGLMVLASFIAIVFYWTYETDKTLFIAVLSGITFVFSVKMIILVAVLRRKLNPIVFRVYMGSTIFMAVLSIFNIVFFSIKASQRLGSSSSSSSSYMPAPVFAPSEGTNA